MFSETQNQYAPDYVSPPGDTLLEKIEELGMSQAELARRTGRPRKTINEIIQGKTAITAETALQLETALGIPASFWDNRERQYRQYLARLEQEVDLKGQIEWLDKFPIADMIEKGWIEDCRSKVLQLRELLQFFGVVSPKQWEVVWGTVPAVFRKSQAYDSNPEALTAWLRRGELEAQSIRCQSYSDETFRRVLKSARSLTLEPPEVFQPEIVELCASAGVAVAFVPQIPESRVSGATRWLTSSKALIQLSLRYKTDDHLWFTFFHEAAHILLHGKRDVFLEACEEDTEKEEEANSFAAEILIPSASLTDFVNSTHYFSYESVQSFAQELGIAPGIVVGRLQHDEHLPFSHLNSLKRRLEWK